MSAQIVFRNATKRVLRHSFPICRIQKRRFSDKSFAELRTEKRIEKGDIRTDSLLAAPAPMNIVPDTVAFKNIDQKGGSKRFYREVFVQQNPENPSEYSLHLDNRVLLLKGKNPMMIPNYHIALLVASEWEAQAEYIRLESMPIMNFEVKRNIMEGDHRRLQRRRGIVETLEHTIGEDLLLLAESEELYQKGFYEKHWEPVVKWFNEKFETQYEVTYIHLEKDNREPSFFEQLIGKEPQEVITEFENFMTNLDQDPKIKEKYEQILHPGKQLVKYRQWLRHQPDLKLLLMDELLAYFPSPILITALVEHVFDLDFFFETINCPELDTQVINDYKVNLKLVESQLFIAAAKTYLNFYEIDKDSRILEKEEIDMGKPFLREFFGPFAKHTHNDVRELMADAESAKKLN